MLFRNRDFRQNIIKSFKSRRSLFSRATADCTIDSASKCVTEIGGELLSYGLGGGAGGFKRNNSETT